MSINDLPVLRSVHLSYLTLAHKHLYLYIACTDTGVKQPADAT